MFDLIEKYNVLDAFWLTIKLTFYAAILSLIWGTILAGMRVSPVPAMRAFGTLYVNLFRNTPLTLILVATSIVLKNTLGVTMFADEQSQDFFAILDFRLAILGLTAYTATFVCESIRSGINTVPVGQAEAARALGLSFAQVLRIIVLPQAFRSVVGPLASVLIALTKNTTVATAIGVAEAAGILRAMIEFESDRIMVVFLIFALGFVILTLPTGLILGQVAKKVAVKR
ncbi:amino acid ABC transporter membrane protein 1 (PAAT family) [Herbihabitans rhizosphaerae]|uniref:Amino acid ABC transporter membrane protein 1 (PAAT family) n=1 Tax=Herbihabitans rhizosphaerae TaxID=1872711 RepID=A0A4Q7KC41_9PSEU|nr:amino acid ABC transporter permease [Herbihabitans rhizosphaerae]RZS30557.1 amino acid ABC transporter membrane protein 1 (PAAT family) [Herbihabitans rhizosphaerae]